MPQSVASERIKQVLAGIPPHITVLAAAKTRSPEEVRMALEAGVQTIGHNYVQEAATSLEALGRRPATKPTEERAAFVDERSRDVDPLSFETHLIGHLQRNKAKLAVHLFDCIQTVDSLRLAEAIDRASANIERVMPVLIEINAAREPQKAGVLPEAAMELIYRISELSSIRINGLMTMGPLVTDPEEIRPSFAETKRLFDELSARQIPNVKMRVLSMGMSTSYQIAIEEGATMIRLGTALFGPRQL